MIASFHLVHYRRRKLSQGRPARTPGLRFWRPLSTGPDFTALNPGVGRIALARPEFKRWAFFGVWEDENALGHFLDTSRLAREWAGHGDEAWHVWLKPIRSAGTWHQINPLEECDGTDVPQAPVAVLTRGDVRVSKLPAFWFWGHTSP